MSKTKGPTRPMPPELKRIFRQLEEDLEIELLFEEDLPYVKVKRKRRFDKDKARYRRKIQAAKSTLRTLQAGPATPKAQKKIKGLKEKISRSPKASHPVDGENSHHQKARAGRKHNHKAKVQRHRGPAPELGD